MKKDSRDFLLEINTEELPAGYVEPAMEGLLKGFRKLEWDVLNDSLVCGASKNSLVLYVRDVPIKQQKESKKFYGPPRKIMFNSDGSPTVQAIGFAKTHGIEPKDLKFEETPKGEYAFIEKKEEPRDTADILREAIPGIIKETHFPKTMKWDDSGLRFARPIESVLALFGKENLGVRLGNVPNKKVSSVTPEQYWKRLKLIDADKRKKEIRRLILKEIKKIKADEAIDKNLLDEVNFLVSSPGAFAGEFDKKLLALPGDVLKASMAKHQRIFPVSKNGKLINKFIAVIDGSGRDIRGVRKNYENILEAKLQDSLFFLVEDTKRPLADNIPKLKDLIFQKDLGNMFEKIQRLRALSAFICEKIGADGSLKKDTERAAELSKADLVTHMVGEFPSLQGVMGREYALRGGERKEAAIAIGEQYLPQRAEDNLPGSVAGAVLAASDKIDNVVGFLGMGAEISGSFDPFGIRRNAQGLIQIIKDRSFRMNLDELIDKALGLYGNKLKADKDRLRSGIMSYVKERIEFLNVNVRAELRGAVLEAGPFDAVDIFNRMAVLKSISDERYFLEAAKVVERTANILKGAKGENIGGVNTALFKEGQEREVWQAYLDSKDKIRGFIRKEQYKEATKEYALAFYKALNDFFDKVLVNAEDKALRLNRLAMMKAINILYTERVANLALLPQIVVK